MTNSMDPDQNAPKGAVCSGSTLFASLLNSSVMLSNYLQQTTFSDVFFFLRPLRVYTFMEIIFLQIQVGQLSVTSESLNTLDIGSLLNSLPMESVVG